MLVSRISSTALNISWDKQTLVELKGLAKYLVEYSEASSVKRQSARVVIVPWTETSVTISDLMAGVEYSVMVSVTTSAGMSGTVTVRSYHSETCLMITCTERPQRPAVFKGHPVMSQWQLLNSIKKYTFSGPYVVRFTFHYRKNGMCFTMKINLQSQCLQYK